MFNRCPLCNQDSLSKAPVASTITDTALELESVVLACGHCGAQLLSPRPTEQQLSTYYSRPVPRTRFQSLSPDSAEFQESFRQALRRANKIQQVTHLPAGRMVVDIGCALGITLGAFKSLGWNPVGVEPNPAFAESAQTTWGVDVLVGTFQEKATEIQSLGAELLQIAHLLHMVGDPLASLKLASQCVAPGGFIVVEVPSELEGYPMRLARVLGRVRRQPAPHPSYRGVKLFYYTRRALLQLMWRAELEVVAMWTYSPTGLGTFLVSMMRRRLGYTALLNERVRCDILGSMVDRMGWGQHLVMIGRKPQSAMRE